MHAHLCAATIAYGMEAIAGKPDLLAIGEMGIGNTTVAAALYAALYGGLDGLVQRLAQAAALGLQVDKGNCVGHDRLR